MKGLIFEAKVVGLGAPAPLTAPLSPGQLSGTGAAAQPGEPASRGAPKPMNGSGAEEALAVRRKAC